MNELPSPAIISAAEVRPERLSDLLLRLTEEAGPRLSIRDIAEAMSERSFGAFLFVFCLPNLMPLPPFATLVLALPLVCLGWQMMLGIERVWLPQAICQYTIDKNTFRSIVLRVTPWLEWSEKWIKPRHWFLDTRLSERIFGVYVFVLGIVVMVPVPFGNWLPSLALAIIAIGLTERDGKCVIFGSLIGSIAIIIFAMVTFMLTHLAAQVL